MNVSEGWYSEMSGEEGSGSAFFNSSNLTLSCAARNIQGDIKLPHSEPLTIIVRVIQSIFYFCVVLGGLAFNATLIVLVAKYKKLQNHSFFISVQVAVVDLLASLVHVAPLLTAITGTWLFGEYGCAIVGLLASTFFLARLFLMFSLIMDRFLAVHMPYYYPRCKWKIVLGFTVFSWVFAILPSVAMVPWFLDCYAFSFGAKMCIPSSRCNGICYVFTLVYYFALTVPMTIKPIVFYSVLYYDGSKVRRSLRADAASANVSPPIKKWKPTITLLMLVVAIFVFVVPPRGVSLAFDVFFDETIDPVAYTILSFSTCMNFLLVIADPAAIMRDQDVREVLSGIITRKGRPPPVNARPTAQN